MKKSELLFNLFLLPLDFLMLISGWLGVYFLRTSPLARGFRPVLFLENLPLSRYFLLVLAIAAIWIFIFGAVGLYKSNFRKGGAGEIMRIAVASLAVLTFILSFIILKQEWFDSRFLIFGGWFLTLLLIFIARSTFRKIFQFILVKYNFGAHRVLIVGKNDNGLNILAGAIDKPSLGYRVIKHLSEPDFDEIKKSIGNPAIDEVILTDLSFSRDLIVRLVNFCEENRINFRFAPDLFQSFIAGLQINTDFDFPILELQRTPLEGWWRIVKRAIDFFGAMVGIIVLAPLWLLIALIIKLDSSGPVFVKLQRIGQGKGFDLYKFRSMINDAHSLKPKLQDFNERHDGPLFKIKNDPRVTKVGKILRKTRIDELPQLINVMRGEMSLVGPRPHEPEEVAKYQSHHKRTFFVKAGITGLAQISGSSDLPFEEEVGLDTFYIKNWSLWLDLKILFKTSIKIFSDRSAC